MILLPIAATILFPLIVYINERNTGGHWYPRGANGQFISKRAAYLRFVPVLIMFWLPYIITH